MLQADITTKPAKNHSNLGQSALSPELAARSLAAAGVSFIPIKIDGSKKPSLEAWKEYQTRRPTDDELAGWFGGGKTRGIGALAGAISGGLEIVDLDAPELRAELEALIEGHAPGLLQRLVIVETPKGGRHYWYRCEKIDGNLKLAQSAERQTLIETRGEGGYVLTPGSPARCHPLHREYKFVRGDFSTIPRITPAERDVLHDVARTFNAFLKNTPAGDSPRGRNTDDALPGVDYSNRATIEEVRAMLEAGGWVKLGIGRHHSELWRRPGKSEGGSSASLFTDSRLFYVHSSNAAPFDAQHAYTPFQLCALLKHGGDFKAAAAALRKAGYGKETQTTPDDLASLTAKGISEEDSIRAGLHEQRNAEMLIERYGDDLRFVEAGREFYAWDGQRWTPGRRKIRHFAVQTAKRFYSMAGKESTPPAIAAEYAKHAKRSLSLSSIEAVARLCENDLSLHIEVDQFDALPHLLNVANGTIDLRTGELLPHDRDHLHSKMIPIEYDPHAECPTWERAILQMFRGNRDIVSFVQRYAGYSATGDTGDQTFLILYGTGANGKSKLLGAIAEVLGAYHERAAAQTLFERRIDAASNDIAKLRGARMVTAIETEAGHKMAAALIKSITGQDKVTARFLFREHFTYEPRYKLWLAVNHRPQFDGSDEAMVRRLRLIPFDVKFEKIEDNPDTEFPRDDNLAEKLRAEYPGILRWIVDGAIMYYRDGLRPPEAVKMATNAYAAEMDSVRSFIAECCITGDAYNVKAGALMDAYQAFCRENGMPPAMGKAWKESLERLGFSKMPRSSTGNFYKGLALVEKEGESG